MNCARPRAKPENDTMARSIKSRPVSRRTVLATLAGGLATPALWRVTNAQGLQKLRFTLPWLPEGSYAYAFVTKGRDEWKKRGFDVTIARGHGALAAAQSIAQGQFDLGLASAPGLVMLAHKGVDLRSLAIMDYEPTMGIGVLAESPIKTPKDLEGKRVGQTLASTDAPFFAPFCEKNGVDIKKVNLVNMDARVRNQALVEGRVDAITGLASSMLGAIGASGKDVRFMLYTQYGLVLYGNVVMAVPPKLLQENAELCRTFTEGLLEGLKFTITKPAESQQLFLDAVPELKMTKNAAEFARLGMGVQRFSVLVGEDDAKVHGLGYTNFDKLNAMTDFVLRYQAEPGTPKPDLKKIFLNQFIGKVKLTADDWAAAEKETKWVADKLGKRA
jgi:ABC-type nitrate/sulfonate/bicarbonate transport system substrate-binding protein